MVKSFSFSALTWGDGTHLGFGSVDLGSGGLHEGRLIYT